MSRKINAGNLDALTNTELRELLTQHGFPNQPVTNTTRTVLISRLRKRMLEGSSGKNANATKTRHTTAGTSNAAAYLSRYSSAEESDRETNVPSAMPPPTTTGSAKRKRGGGTQPASYSFFSPASTSSVSYSSTTNLPTIKVPIQSRSSAYIPPPAMHQGSDTDESDTGGGGGSSGGGGGGSSRGSSSVRSSSRNPYLSYGRLSGLSFPKRYSPSNLDASPVSRTSSYASHSNHASPRLSDTNNSSSGAEDSSPFVSDFTKRLLQFRDRNLAQDNAGQAERRGDAGRPAALPPQPNPRYFYRMPSNRYAHQQHSVVHQAAAGGAGNASEGSFLGSISNPLASLRSFFSSGQQRQNLVPLILFHVLILFIAFLMFMYLTISPDLVSTITAENAKFSLCSEDSLNYAIVAAENCIFENDLEPALDFLRLLVPELQSRVQRHMCIDPGVPAVLKATEAMKMRVDSLLSHDEYDTHRTLLNMEYLIDQNPQWHISNLDDEGAAMELSKVRQLPAGHATSFGILKPRLPLTCLFLRKLQTFFFIVGTLGLVSAGAYLGNVVYKFYVRQKQERQTKLNRIISHILQVVMEQAGNFPGNPEAAAVVVNHLRDKIVEPAQRTKEMEKLWRDAVSFLEHHESRVQFEIGTRNGEECKLVRWVDTTTTSPVTRPAPAVVNGGGGSAAAAASSARPSNIIPQSLYNAAQLSKVGESMLSAKKWQSPAFDKTNKISSPPTPCLKIRQMFDKYEAANPNLKTIIADAILEKVGPQCKIYDIFLEPQSCCVYVRCATAKDAGMVHDEVNGWWFDNRLVSIKFMRLERFMDRFPGSANHRHLMRPSNPQKLSLTQCNDAAEDDDDDDEEADEELEEEEAAAADDEHGTRPVNGRP